jgi:hypothetical protein
MLISRRDAENAETTLRNRLRNSAPSAFLRESAIL